MYLNMYIFVYLYIYVYIYIFISIQIYTYIYIILARDPKHCDGWKWEKDTVSWEHTYESTHMRAQRRGHIGGHIGIHIWEHIGAHIWEHTHEVPRLHTRCASLRNWKPHGHVKKTILNILYGHLQEKCRTPSPGTPVLCEPAQLKRTWTCQKSHFVR